MTTPADKADPPITEGGNEEPYKFNRMLVLIVFVLTKSLFTDKKFR